MPPSQCQTCGAITDFPESRPRQQVRGSQSPVRQILRFLALSKQRKGVVVVFVLLILSVIISGSTVILPISLHSSRSLLLVNVGVTWVLTFFVFFNFFSAMYSRTSTVKAFFGDKMPTCPPTGQAFKGWAYCRSCQWFKPAEASHCRVCNVCIVSKDHHCVFIDQCVGRGNMRSFLLLLFFTLVSCAFCFSHMVVFLILERGSFASSLVMAWAQSKGPMILLLYLNIFLSLKWPQVVCLWNLFFSISIIYGVSTLLWSILEALPSLEGETTDINSDEKRSKLSKIISGLSLIMRGKKGSWIMWIWPLWSFDSNLSMSSRETWCSPQRDKSDFDKTE